MIAVWLSGAMATCGACLIRGNFRWEGFSLLLAGVMLLIVAIVKVS